MDVKCNSVRSDSVTELSQLYPLDECQLWAKTFEDAESGQLPGISVSDHCLNVGCVAESFLSALPPQLLAIFPRGAATLAASHDIGKITLGFQSKCPSWLAKLDLDDRSMREIALSLSDHAYVSQYFLQEHLRAFNSNAWAIAVGSHHGKPKGRVIKPPIEARAGWAQEQRMLVLQHLVKIFGALPENQPSKVLEQNNTDLWLLAGLITVADWIGSNEAFFSPFKGASPDISRVLASSALNKIGWPGGKLRHRAFNETFGFDPNTVQSALLANIDSPALIIVEAPMGCGKTEAALAVAQKLIAAGHHHGMYFALPTQVTSNRVHRRVIRFLENSLEDPARLRLAHGNSWMENDFDITLRPSFVGDGVDAEEPRAIVTEARSWFSSSKQALLAPYGVGTIDQALQGMVAVKHFFVRRFALAGKVVILDEIHSYDVYTGTLVTALVGELLRLGCTVIVLSATLTGERRREILTAAESHETGEPNAYPLITTARRNTPAKQITPVLSATQKIYLRTEPFTEENIITELISRAEVGQHVLWIRNTVAEAQTAFRLIRGDTPVSGEPEHQVRLGLLHSRFPQRRRQQLENTWLDHLGKNRPAQGAGSILVATQVVEQSVDIDLDFIVSDLAPTDMLFQRMGRLWRHPRDNRSASQPEFWVRLPKLPASPSNKADLKKSLGRSGYVYAPWVLLRTAFVFTGRKSVTLPDAIRPLLEITYSPPNANESEAWHDLHAELLDEKQKLRCNAEAAMLVLGRPTLSVDEGSDQALTRRKGPPTSSVLLLDNIEELPGHIYRLTALDGSVLKIATNDWNIEAARFIHPWIVKVPKWLVPASAPCPRWLSLHVHGQATFATVAEHGRLCWEGESNSTIYHPDFGIYADKIRPSKPSTHPIDDDEFDY